MTEAEIQLLPRVREAAESNADEAKNDSGLESAESAPVQARAVAVGTSVAKPPYSYFGALTSHKTHQRGDKPTDVK